MKTSTVKTIFHILGAAFSMVAFFLLLLAIFASGRRASAAPIIVLIFALVIGGLGVYMLAGAPRWTLAIKRRFPGEAANKTPRPFNPRHKLKARIGISLGGLTWLSLLLPLMMPDSHKMPEGLLYLILPLMILGPLAGIWGAMHLAFCRGHPPVIALLPAGIGLLVTAIWPFLGLSLVAVGPAIVIRALPRSGRGAP